MIRLSQKPRPPVEIVFEGGAKVVTRIPSAVETSAAESAMRRRIVALRDGQDALAPYGVQVGAAQLDDLDTAFGVGSLVMLTELALACFEAWHGVETEDGPAELTRENIAIFLRDTARHRRVFAVLNETAAARAQEGNGSASSPNGAPAGASNIAGRAAKPARPARAAKRAKAAGAARNGKAKS